MEKYCRISFIFAEKHQSLLNHKVFLFVLEKVRKDHGTEYKKVVSNQATYISSFFKRKIQKLLTFTRGIEKQSKIEISKLTKNCNDLFETTGDPKVRKTL